MSTLDTTTSTSRPTLGTGDAGESYFETDTKNIVVWDGTQWRGYQTDGLTFGGNSYVAELNGTNQYLTLGDVSGTLGGANKCTVSWWLKQPTFTHPSDHGLMFQTGNGVTNGLFVYFNVTYWSILVGDGSGGFVGVRTSGTSSIEDNQWHLWTVVYDGTQSTNITKVVIYKDTALQTMAIDTAGTVATSLPSTCGDDPYVGAYYNNGIQNYNNASFDDFAIFDDALNSTQVANIYNNQIYPSSLKHLYRLENNVDDSVGTADGTQVNSPITNSPSSFPY